MKQLTPYNISQVLKQIFDEHVQEPFYQDPLYDVDMFKSDVSKYDWAKEFNTKDSDFLAVFLDGIMLFCYEDHDDLNYYGLTGHVIIFSELSEWAKEVFNG